MLRHRKQLGHQPIEAGDLLQHVADRSLAARIIAGERILALQAQGRDRVADLVCDTSRYTTDGGEALRRRDPYGQRLRFAACLGETPTGFVQRTDDAIELAFPGLVQRGFRLDRCGRAPSRYRERGVTRRPASR